MKIPKSALGQYVEIIWRDPFYARGPLKESPKGWDSLRTWKSRGVITDMTDGVIRVEHSVTVNDEQDEAEVTLVPEALIENLLILIPQTINEG